MKKIKPTALLALMAILLITACSSQPEPVEIAIEMSEFAFTPDKIDVQPGQEVTLVLKNTGALEHELMIGQGSVKENNRPNGYEKDLFSAARTEPQVTGEAMKSSGEHEHGHDGTMVVIPPSEQAAITFVVTPNMTGYWEMGCFSQAGVHYDAGMLGQFVVTP